MILRFAPNSVTVNKVSWITRGTEPLSRGRFQDERISPSRYGRISLSAMYRENIQARANIKYVHIFRYFGLSDENDKTKISRPCSEVL